MAVIKRNGKKGVSYGVDFYDADGNRVRKWGFKTEREAKRAEEAAKTDIRRGEFRFVRRIRSPRFAEFAKEYLEVARQNKRSWDQDRGIIKTHLVPFFSNRRLSEIHSFDIERYKALRLDAGASKGTIDRELACLRHMLNLAVKWGKLKQNLISSEQFYRESTMRDCVISPEQESRLLAASSPPLKAITGLALSTGMRKRQILNLRWNQVDLTRRTVSLPARANKDKKAHLLPLNETARAILSELPRGGDYVFGGKKPRRTIDKAFKNALRKAGLPEEIRFHDLRHTFGTRLAERGCDSATLKELMQHSSLQMTQRYIHPSRDAMRRGVALLDSQKMVTFPTSGQEEKKVAVAGGGCAIRLGSGG